jgi:energy-coupling factor transport system permease protein
MAFVLQMLEMGKLRSPIHRLDPRAKLIWWICLIVVPILVTNPFILLGFTIWIWGMAVVAGITKRMYKFLIVSYPVMIGFIVLTWPFFYPATPDQRYLFQFGILHWSLEGTIYAMAMGMRIILALTACTFFVMTTDLMGLASAMGEFMQNKLKISYMYPLMVISSFKFLPELSGDYITITDSFKSRACDMDAGPFGQRMKKTVPVAIPLIDCMLRKATRISIALEVKAFDVEMKSRTFYEKYTFHGKDLLFILGGVLAILISILAMVYGVAKVELYL